MATYDGYQAYKKAKAQGKRGYKLALAVAWAVAGNYIKVGKVYKYLNLVNGSVLKKASKVAFQAARNVGKFSVSNKHLANAGGRYRKFNTTSQREVRRIIYAALRSRNAQFLPNNQPNSYVVITNLGRKIGTKGETRVKVVVGGNGKIWTAYPIK
jgi:hypothetical protein